jgi:2-desacetyl-2-hydroxyethyl bacteriochlorophyllide A dehydrogenase
MKVLMYEGPTQLNIRDIPVPSLEAGEALVKVEFTGICGSELSGYLGQNSLRIPPIIMGHEFSGTIAKIEGGAPGWGIGDRVTVNPLQTCGTCGYCVNDQQQLCENRVLLGAGLAGSYSEYIKVSIPSLVRLPEGMSFEEGALVEPLACAMRVKEVADIKKNNTVLIFGLGPIGLLVLKVLKKAGVKEVYVVDRNEKRLNIAMSIGGIPLDAGEDLVSQVMKRTEGIGVDAAIDAVGADITRQQSILACRNGGRAVFTGLHTAETSLLVNEIIRKEIKISGSFAYSHPNFLKALHFIEREGKILKEEWLVKAPLEEGKAWFDRLLTNPEGVIKVLLSP